MSQRFETPSVHHYDDHADEYVRDTVGINMESLYGPFLDLLPNDGNILDAGCGSGRDTKAFLARGYDVIAIDASEGMVAATTRLTGKPARQILLQEIEYQNEFDGIWACASLLHVPRVEIDGVLNRFARALRPRGICYLSFKEGEDERMQGERRFTDFIASSLEDCLVGHSDLDVVSIWITDDARPGRTERWVNALARNGSE